MGRSSQDLGARGEALAAAFLERRGLRVVARRFRGAGGELDLVARESALWVIVEVKARGPDSWARGAAAVDRRKRLRIARATRAFLCSRGLGEPPLRYDVVELTLGSGLPRLRWTRGAFEDPIPHGRVEGWSEAWR